MALDGSCGPGQTFYTSHLGYGASVALHLLGQMAIPQVNAIKDADGQDDFAL